MLNRTLCVPNAEHCTDRVGGCAVDGVAKMPLQADFSFFRWNLLAGFLINDSGPGFSYIVK